MFDADSMYPDGFHPMSQSYARTSTEPVLARHKDRHHIPPRKLRYYYTDFGISTLFQESQVNRLVVGSMCQDRTVPEINDVVPYDPFKVDMYILGNVYADLFKVRLYTFLLHGILPSLSALFQFGIFARLGGHDGYAKSKSTAICRRSLQSL